MRELPFKSKFIIAASLTAMLLVGFGLRVHNLGLLGLVADEGHQALAVDGVLHHGYPLVPSGLIYSRGLIFLYLQSISAFLLGLNEFALRFPGVLFNIATIIMIYVFGRTLFDSRIGLLSATIVTLSAWEIDLSRYARMYTALQFFFLISLYFFYRGFIKGDRIHRFLVIPAFVITFMIHDIGITLLTVFAVPFFLKSYRVVSHKILIVYASVLIIGFVSYKKFINLLYSALPKLGLNSGAPNSSGRELSIASALNWIKGHFILPEIGLLKNLIIQHSEIFLFLIFMLIATIGYLIWKAYSNPEQRWENILALPIVLALFLYQFTFALVLFGLYGLLFYRIPKSVSNRSFFVIYLTAGFTLFFWFLYVWIYPDSQSNVSIAESFFGFPNFYGYLLRWFLEDWPRFIAVVAVGIGVMVVYVIREKDTDPYIFLLLSFLLPVLMAAFVSRPFYEARYVFHLYPLMIIIFSFMVIQVTAFLTQKTATLLKGTGNDSGLRKMTEIAIAGILAVFLSQDISPTEALAISNRTYQTTKDPVKGALNWIPYAEYHQDYKDAAEYVKTHRQAGDIVIVAGAPHVGSIYYYYLGKVNYVLLVPQEIKGISIRINNTEGPVHYIIGASILSDPHGLEAMLEKNRGRPVWLLTDTYLLEKYYSPELRAAVKKIFQQPLFQCRDGRTLVYRIEYKTIGLHPHNNRVSE